MKDACCPSNWVQISETHISCRPLQTEMEIKNTGKDKKENAETPLLYGRLTDYRRPDFQAGSKCFTLLHYQTRVTTCPAMKSSMEKIKNHQTKLVLAKNKS